MSVTVITRHSTMGEVLESYPSAQRALFQRYHIGGCNSCGYQPGDTLDAVARSHNILDVGEVVVFLDNAEQLDRQVVGPHLVAGSEQRGRWRGDVERLVPEFIGRDEQGAHQARLLAQSYIDKLQLVHLYLSGNLRPTRRR